MAPQLPPEIVEHAISTCDNHSLAQFALTSRRLNVVSERVLYRHLYICIQDPDDVGFIQLQVLMNSVPKGSYARSICIDVGQFMHNIGGINHSAASFHNGCQRVAAAILSALENMPNLQHLALIFDYNGRSPVVPSDFGMNLDKVLQSVKQPLVGVRLPYPLSNVLDWGRSCLGLTTIVLDMSCNPDEEQMLAKVEDLRLMEEWNTCGVRPIIITAYHRDCCLPGIQIRWSGRLWEPMYLTRSAYGAIIYISSLSDQHELSNVFQTLVENFGTRQLKVLELCVKDGIIPTDTASIDKLLSSYPGIRHLNLLSWPQHAGISSITSSQLLTTDKKLDIASNWHMQLGRLYRVTFFDRSEATRDPTENNSQWTLIQ
ncbi:hypothetical protein C8J56DRAFT_1031802 [Mycena floridula]|nr:hypothetical protein C8J56DRAFT_1032283 [Mycena floridula]KAJ7576565.1 hypothetical protein C8J56DRAFT_1031802 [Mycena floridula]